MSTPARKPGLANNPLAKRESRLPNLVQAAAGGSTETPAETPAPAVEKNKGGRPKGSGSNLDTVKSSITFTKSRLEEARNAVEFLKEDPTAPRSLTNLIDLALYKLLAELRDQCNDGKEFPEREGKLKPGPK